VLSGVLNTTFWGFNRGVHEKELGHDITAFYLTREMTAAPISQGGGSNEAQRSIPLTRPRCFTSTPMELRSPATSTLFLRASKGQLSSTGDFRAETVLRYQCESLQLSNGLVLFVASILCPLVRLSHDCPTGGFDWGNKGTPDTPLHTRRLDTLRGLVGASAVVALETLLGIFNDLRLKKDPECIRLSLTVCAVQNLEHELRRERLKP
jgi:hypothetical protein